MGENNLKKLVHNIIDHSCLLLGISIFVIVGGLIVSWHLSCVPLFITCLSIVSVAYVCAIGIDTY